MKNSHMSTWILISTQNISALFLAIRPKHWTKNLLVYLVFFFTVGEAWSPDDLHSILMPLYKSSLAFVIFSILSSGIYIVNDILDIQRDHKHPTKRLRPIASGILPVTLAWITATILISVGSTAAFVLEPLYGVIALTYVTTMTAYSVFLKRIIILDVFAISGGFILRAITGAVVIQVPVSPWLYVCTGLGALFIALCKRKSELTIAGENAGLQRDTLQFYTISLLEHLINIVTASVALSYIFYTFTATNLPDNHSMLFTIPFVIYGLFRYLYLTHTKNLGENPEEIITNDIPLIITIVLWLIFTATILTIART